MKVKATTISAYDSDESRLNSRKTIHILGAVRGGTTSVANVVYRLGIYLGDDMGENLEDLTMREKHGLDHIRQTISARNEAHDVWGWKHPQSDAYLPEILPELRNLRLIVVTRDMTANALGVSTRMDLAELKAMDRAIRRMRYNLDFVGKVQRPTLFVSYEKLLVRPEPTIREIAAFCGKELSAKTEREIAETIRPGRYGPVPNSSLLADYFRRAKRKFMS